MRRNLLGVALAALVCSLISPAAYAQCSKDSVGHACPDGSFVFGGGGTTYWYAADGSTELASMDGSGNFQCDGTMTVGGATTFTGLLTASAGIVVSTVGVTVTAGDLLMTLGDITMTAGDFVNTLGDMTLTAGSFLITLGDATLTDGDLLLSSGNVTLTAGNIVNTLGDLTLTDGDALLSSGNLTLTAGNIVNTLGDLTLTDGDALLSSGNLTLTAGNIVNTLGNITATAGNIVATLGDITATDGNITASSGNIVASDGDVSVALGDIDLTAGDLDIAAVAIADGNARVTVAGSAETTAGDGDAVLVTLDMDNSAGVRLTTGAMTGYTVTPTGHASDSGGTYYSFYADDTTASGGAGTFDAYTAGAGYDNCLACGSGQIDVAAGGIINAGTISTASTVDGLDLNPVSTETDGLSVQRLAKGTFTCAGGGVCDVGAVPFGPTLPDNARVIQCWYEVRTAFTDGDDESATIALGFATDGTQADILAVAAISTNVFEAADMGDCIPDALVANFIPQLTAGRQFLATVADDNIDDGVLDLFCYYYVGQ
jgi:hypothetical protein